MAKKKYQVNLTVHRWEGFPVRCEDGNQQPMFKGMKHTPVLVKLKWKGTKGGPNPWFGRSLMQASTTEKIMESGCTVNWDEEFEHVCVLSMTKERRFLPWDIKLLVMQVGRKPCVLGTAILNLGDFACSTEKHVEHTTKVHISTFGDLEVQSSILIVTVKLTQLASNETSNLERLMSPSLACLSGPLIHEQKMLVEMKAKDMKRSTSFIEGKTQGNGDISPSIESSAYTALSGHTEYVDAQRNVGSGEGTAWLCSYGSLATVNLILEGALSYSMNSILDEESLTLRTEIIPKLSDEMSSSDSDHNSSSSQHTARSFLPWKKRKMSFRNSRSRGEPLLNKDSEDGGDDIDHDRRFSEPLSANLGPENGGPTLSLTFSDCLDFGEENFSVGKWEKKDIASRDGEMKLTTDVFFASIDQRHEKAAGQGACTVLAAVIADWLHRNPNRMPIQAEFDTLIREGSAEWRKLCDIEELKTSFPDGHFDLDTVLESKVRSLSVIQDQIFVGFFQPEGIGDTCKFLHGANTFEDTWEQMENAAFQVSTDGSVEPAICIVSWNDHFFILKVEKEAYYIIDTLGERLYEGCKQAYILRFGEGTQLCCVPKTRTMDAQKDHKEALCGSTREDDKTFVSANPKSSTSPKGQHVVSSKHGAVISSSSSTTSSSSLSSSSSSPSSESLSLSSSSPPPPSRSPSPSLSLSPSPLSSLASSSSLSQLSPLPNNQVNASKLQNCEDPAVYMAKDACKEFVKGFFAALPLKELQTDIEKGLLRNTPLHMRLQIEFTFTSIK